MKNFKIGIILDSLKLNLKEGIKKAAELGAEGLQFYAIDGEMAPENLPLSKRREILDMIESNNMVVAAICGDLGGYGFSIGSNNSQRIDKSKRIMELAKDLKCNIVTTHIGVIPADKSNSRWGILADACRKLGEFAEDMDSYFAIETGPEKAIVLKDFLENIGTKGIAVNYDPANFVMVTGEDPVQSVFTLKDYIVHTHAKDGIMLKQTDPEIIYKYFAEGGIEDINLKDYFLETPLGEGNVNFKEYLGALNKIGYKGFLTIEREVGDKPLSDIKHAIEFLKELIEKL